jgi:hypothetical protein
MTSLLADATDELPTEAQAVLAGVLPAVGLAVEYRARLRAGVGSLGRPRFVALAEWAGGWICREVKAVAPPATVWAKGRNSPGHSRIPDAVRGAIRAPDPFYRLDGRWVARRLGPRSSRIELRYLATPDAERVLHGMGTEAANVHLGTTGTASAILSDLARRPIGWLEVAAQTLAGLIELDWATWRSIESADPDRKR